MLVLLKTNSLFEITLELLLKIPKNKNSQNDADKKKTEPIRYLKSHKNYY